MAALDMTSADAAVKVHYTPARLKAMAYKNNPTLAMLPKYTKFGGKNLPIPIWYENAMGRSANFTKAGTAKKASKFEDFVLTRVKDYGLADIDNETILATKGDSNAFMEALTHEVDSITNEVVRSLAKGIFRKSVGNLLQYTISSGVCTCVNADEVVNISVGMILASVDADDGTGTVAAGLGYVIAVNRAAGTFTVSATDGGAAGTPSGWANNEYVHVDGDFNARLSGFESWCPATAPGSTAFFGVDRSVDSRLGGLRYDASSLPIEEGLLDAESLAGREGAKLDVFVMNHKNYTNLVKSLGSKVIYDTVKASDADIGFSAIQVMGSNGPVKVVADHNCPAKVAWGLELDSWKLYSLGPAPQLLETDGNRVLRLAASDAVEVRVGYYAQLGCNAPGHNIRVTLAA